MSDSLSDYLRSLPKKVFAVEEEAFTELSLLALESIKTGSSLTGSPGQPVDKGELLGSWGLEMRDATHASIVSVGVPYAQVVEDGIGSHGQVVSYGAANPHSPAQTGGSHSVALTVVGMQRLADDVGARR